jgi:hypothetical protein
MNRLFVVGLVLLLGLGAGSVATAQEATPLMMVVNGTLYRLNGVELVPYTECQPTYAIVETPVISGDNNHFAFLVLPAVVSDNLDALGTFGGEFPTDVWVCDHASKTLRQLTTQPEGTDLTDNATDNNGTLRSLPAWSSNGTQIAWSEFTPDSQYQFGVYNVITQEQFISPLPNLPVQSTVIAPEIFWSLYGIHVLSYEARQSVIDTSVYSYDVNGTYLTNVFLMTQSEPTSVIYDYQWVNVAGVTYFIGDFSDRGWALVHLLTGQVFTLEVPSLALRALNANDIQNTLDYSILDDGTNVWTTLYWLDENASPDSFLAYSTQQMAFSPDGTRLAYLDIQLRLWDLGDSGNIPNTLLANTDIAGIVWGATQWDLDVSQQEPYVIGCTDILPSRFAYGDTGKLSGSTSANNVRNAPTTTGEAVGKLTPDMSFTALVGPVCAEGYSWYQIVVADQFLGWTVEATPTEYWLEKPE